MNVYFKNGSSFTSIYDLIYPVGSVFIANTWSFNAPSQFGGGWENPPDGLVYGTSSSYNVGAHLGGSAITLSWDNMPPHTHGMTLYRNGDASWVGSSTARAAQLSSTTGIGFQGSICIWDGVNGYQTQSAGGGSGFDVLPSLSRNEFHVWRRIS